MHQDGTMTKIVHCIRHGQSTFNAHFARAGVDPLHFDAPLTELGQRQVAEAAARAARVPYELVVTSPLTRAIQTTLGLFGEHPAAPPIHGRVPAPGASGEQLRRRPRRRRCCSQEFPHLAFGHLEEVWWHNDGRAGRARASSSSRRMSSRTGSSAFRGWLAARPERLIAVVGHGTFFYHLTGRFLANCEVAALEL